MSHCDHRRLALLFALSASLSGCSEAEVPVDENGAALSKDAHMEQQADSLEEAADKAMEMEIESLESEQQANPSNTKKPGTQSSDGAASR